MSSFSENDFPKVRRKVRVRTKSVLTRNEKDIAHKSPPSQRTAELDALDAPEHRRRLEEAEVETLTGHRLGDLGCFIGELCVEGAICLML